MRVEKDIDVTDRVAIELQDRETEYGYVIAYIRPMQELTDGELLEYYGIDYHSEEYQSLKQPHKMPKLVIRRENTQTNFVIPQGLWAKCLRVMEDEE